MKDLDVHGALSIGLAVGVLTMIFIPVATEAQTSGWCGAIKEYQTLIGGALAVGAAWYTVRQMRASDFRSDKRHEDLLKLQMGGDIRRLERAINPQRSDLDFEIDDLEVIRTAIYEVPEADRQEMIDRQLERIVQVFINVASILGREHFQDGAQLFEGYLAQQCQHLRRRSVKCADDLALSYKPGTLDIVLADLREIISLGRVVVRSMDDLAAKYGIEILGS